MNKKMPPQFALRFFRSFCDPGLRDHIEGDLIELYDERVRKSGKRKADAKFIIDVMMLFRPGIIKKTERRQQLNTAGMYKNYLLIGWRNLKKNKGYSIINIGSLALGMTVAILIGLWVYDELTFNASHENHRELAKVYRKQQRNGESFASTFQVPGLATVLKDEYGSHFKNVVVIRGQAEDATLSVNDHPFSQKGYFVQPQFLEMFTPQMLNGSNTALNDMKSIIISQTLAEKLFPNGNPLNEPITMDSRWDLKITGVFKDIPKNSEFSGASFFAPFDLFTGGNSTANVWDNYFVNIYVQADKSEPFENISDVIKNSMLPHLSAKAAELKPEVFLLPFDDLHLSSEFKDGKKVTSTKMQSVKYYSVIGVFVLLLACINFMNLSTARSEKRAKEVGIRKSIGSQRSQLIQQFFSESFLVAFISFIFSLLLATLTLPLFNTIADKDMMMPWTKPVFWMAGGCFVLFTGLLAGSYPAFYLSSFQPLKVLKGTFKAGRFASAPRRVLVIIQFTVSICLIAGTVIVYEQIQFAKNRPVGYSRAGLITFPSRAPEFKGKSEILRTELKATGYVEDIASADYELTSILGNNDGFSWKGKDENITDPSFNTVTVSHEYGKTVGWEFLMGRDFSRQYGTDAEGVVINESAWKIMAMKDPVGETIVRDRGDSRETYTILGVVKDMVKGSPYEPTNPAIHFLTERDLRWKFLRISPDSNPGEVLPKIETAFHKVISSAPFDFRFADDEYDAKFRSEERIGVLALIFSALAILISCSGLFGLAAFVAEQRTKEISIRKVLGASVSNVWRLLSFEFIALVIIASSISIPLTYYMMKAWLLQYNYHVAMNWYSFAAAGIGALMITLITVTFQTIKVALSNPVKSLRSE